MRVRPRCVPAQVTDIYGVMYKPYDFDPEREYPVVAYVYPGPQTEAVAKSFGNAGATKAFQKAFHSKGVPQQQFKRAIGPNHLHHVVMVCCAGGCSSERATIRYQHTSL